MSKVRLYRRTCYRTCDRFSGKHYKPHQHTISCGKTCNIHKDHNCTVTKDTVKPTPSYLVKDLTTGLTYQVACIWWNLKGEIWHVTYHIKDSTNTLFNDFELIPVQEDT